MRTRRSPKNQDRLWRELGREKAPAKCVWKADEDGNWHTECGNLFILNDGTPADNGMKYCCYCGKPLKQNVYEEEGGST